MDDEKSGVAVLCVESDVTGVVSSSQWPSSGVALGIEALYAGCMSTCEEKVRYSTVGGTLVGLSVVWSVVITEDARRHSRGRGSS